MNTKTPSHRFLKIAPRALTKSEARERIKRLLGFSFKIDVDKVLRGDPNPGFTFTDRHGKAKRFTYRDLVDQTSRTGVIPEGDRVVWSDSHLDGTIACATDANELPEMVLTTASGSFTTSGLEAPGSLTNDVMVPLLEDVLYYRREAVRWSFFNDSHYERSFRAYRGYLTACISAVDAYLNERAWFALRDPNRNLTPKERKVLEENLRRSLTIKLKKWPRILFGVKLGKALPELVAFHEIREGRNGFVHVNSPEFNFSLRRAPGVMNLCRKGVGGLLAYLELHGKRYPAPKMLEVRFAPKITFRTKPNVLVEPKVAAG